MAARTAPQPTAVATVDISSLEAPRRQQQRTSVAGGGKPKLEFNRGVIGEMANRRASGPELEPVAAAERGSSSEETEEDRAVQVQWERERHERKARQVKYLCAAASTPPFTFREKKV